MSANNFLKSVLNRLRSKPIQNMATMDTVQRLESRAVQVENLISVLKAEVVELQKAANFCQQNLKDINVKKFEEIKLENEKLRKEVDEWKSRLIQAESKLGLGPIQVSVPASKKSPPKEQPSEVKAQVDTVKAESPAAAATEAATKKKAEKVKGSGDEEKKEKAAKTPNKGAKAEAPEAPVDVARLDIRVGKIVSVKKHPDADSLYVEEVDLGEDKPRTVVSGLVKYVPIEEMQDRMVVALCNLKPAKMRGVTSEAMVLCASTPEAVEVLSPPEGSCPGDRIRVDGYPGEPDPVLNPKKKIFETVAPDLKTDGQKVATYKGVPFTVPGKGVVTTKSLTQVQIK